MNMREIMNLMEQPAPDPTTSPAFRAWFGQSKLVDDQGKPMVLYHGTTKAFDTFKLPGRGEYRAKAIFLAMDPEIASYFTHGSGSVMPCYVRAENLFDYRNPDHLARLGKWLSVGFSTKVPGALYSAEAAVRWLGDGDFGLLEQPTVQAWLRRSKFDGFYVTEGRGDLNVAVFSPNQIKSVYNAGEFSRDSNHVSETAP